MSMLRILLVDDDVIVRKWLRLVFESHDREFTVAGFAANGREALEFCRREGADIVITDMIMPDMDGMTFIQGLREWDLRTQVIILSNYADFSLAQKGLSFGAAEYLLKGEITEEELLEVTRRVGARLAGGDRPAARFWGFGTVQIGQIISGGWPETDAALDREMQRRAGRVWCLVFCQDAPGRPAGQGWAREAEAILSGLGLRAGMYVISDRVVAALVADEGGAQCAELAARLQTCTGGDGAPFSLGMDGPARSAEEVRLAFSHACEAARLRFFRGPGCVCVYEEDSREPGMDFQTATQQAYQFVKAGEWNRLKGLIDGVRSGSDRYSVEDIDRLRRLFNAVAEAVIHHAQVCCESAPQLQDTNPIAEIGSILFLDDLAEWLCRLICQCRDLVQRSAGEESMQRVLAYIEQNYMNELTLHTISEVAGFSPNYFCNVFKERTGKSVSSYLTDVRIEHAKRMLTTTGKSIHLIAEDVGYESPSYFIKVFKDMTGVTPNRFRKLNR